MAAVLKVKCQGEVHRVSLPHGRPTFDVIQKCLNEIYPDEAFVAKYFDEEQDLCTLCPGTFEDFVAGADMQGCRQIFKVELLHAKLPETIVAAVAKEHVPSDVDMAKGSHHFASKGKCHRKGKGRSSYIENECIPGNDSGYTKGTWKGMMRKGYMKGAHRETYYAEREGKNDVDDSKQCNDQGTCDKNIQQQKCATQGCSFVVKGGHRAYCCLACRRTGDMHGPFCSHTPTTDGCRASATVAADAEQSAQGEIPYDGAAPSDLDGSTQTRQPPQHMKGMPERRDEAEVGQVCKPCDRVGCNYSSTWHATHCCEGCRRTGEKHGPRCEKHILPQLAEVSVDTEEVTHFEQVLQPNDGSKPCGRLGCRFMATWNSTHCCNRCRVTGEEQHGPRCEQKLSPQLAHVQVGMEETQHFEQVLVPRVSSQPCGRVGCKYMATWHATHCCAGCRSTGDKHGPRCEQKIIVADADQAAQVSSADINDSQHDGGWAQPEGVVEGSTQFPDNPPHMPDSKIGCHPCGRVGCNFTATWHVSHCCEGCRVTGRKHGPRCEQKTVTHDDVEHDDGWTELERTEEPSNL